MDDCALEIPDATNMLKNLRDKSQFKHQASAMRIFSSLDDVQPVFNLIKSASTFLKTAGGQYFHSSEPPFDKNQGEALKHQLNQNHQNPDLIPEGTFPACP